MSDLAGKRIFLGVCGGIACYKIVEVARQLTRRGAAVDVAMTQSATRFVGPLTFETLTRRRVLLDALALDERSEIAHVQIGKAADLIVVAPATCNMIARLAHGLAEDPISVTVLASPARVLVVPAMDDHMWANQATQTNLATLRQRGFEVLPPLQGELASGAIGWGRLPELEDILEAVEACLLPGPLTGKSILVTAGGTQEPIDPVRFLGNRSSGKMGIAVAEEARRRGADVTLIHAAVGVPLPAGIRALKAPTAEEMAEAVRVHAQQADALVMAAAVADFRPQSPAGR
ncbi:MAG: bifunctional phosphopantothenoylcysteine decarboxylase/phosphopantothenate--cysteine ligase CoaBC, partial [Chloroflexota bacterium]|nr:bifunctional phosphopantothenoylcysteine decarboxylase/phosphopantothenate--cysteine ligase CoaBC [Chloroflexota bacterium]